MRGTFNVGDNHVGLCTYVRASETHVWVGVSGGVTQIEIAKEVHHEWNAVSSRIAPGGQRSNFNVHRVKRVDKRGAL